MRWRGLYYHLIEHKKSHGWDLGSCLSWGVGWGEEEEEGGGKREGVREQREKGKETGPVLCALAPPLLAQPETHWAGLALCWLHTHFPSRLLPNKAPRVTSSRKGWFFQRNCCKPEASFGIPRTHVASQAPGGRGWRDLGAVM